MLKNVYKGLNARSKVHLSKVYFCKMHQLVRLLCFASLFTGSPTELQRHSNQHEATIQALVLFFSCNETQLLKLNAIHTPSHSQMLGGVFSSSRFTGVEINNSFVCVGVGGGCNSYCSDITRNYEHRAHTK